MAMSNSFFHRPLDRNGFSIAIICALRTESDAVEALIDEFWERDGFRYGKVAGDPNSYRLGRMGVHNVVITYLPGMGNTSSASAAASFRASFPNVQLGLVVGVCGGVPRPGASGKDVFLGDVIISTGVVQYDFGWQYPDRTARKDTLNDNLGRPNSEVRAFLRQIQGWDTSRQVQQNISKHLAQVLSTGGFEDWSCPRSDDDNLFESTYRHKHQTPHACDICARCVEADDPVCDEALVSSCVQLGCNETSVVNRRNTNTEAVLHFGLVGSGNAVMKSGIHRDMIASAEQIIGFEMEGAGAWDSFPTIIVKGVVDYADSHKNSVWHRFGAMIAASCAKALLQEWRSNDQFTAAAASASSSTGAIRLQQGEHEQSERTTAWNASFVTHGSVKNMAKNQYISGDLNIN